MFVEPKAKREFGTDEPRWHVRSEGEVDQQTNNYLGLSNRILGAKCRVCNVPSTEMFDIVLSLSHLSPTVA